MGVPAAGGPGRKSDQKPQQKMKKVVEITKRIEFSALTKTAGKQIKTKHEITLVTEGLTKITDLFRKTFSSTHKTI